MTGSEPPDHEPQSPDEPPTALPGSVPAYPPPVSGPPEPERPHGSIRRQEPGVTQPRPPTVAEARARDKARKRAADAERAIAEANIKRRKRNRRLIGGAAVVGVVAVVAVGYKVLSSHDNVTARCVQDVNGDDVVVEDRYCGGTPGANGIFILGGSQYRYYYGGTGDIGQRPSGGSTVAPKGANVTTKSGSTVSRGGLGSNSGGKSGGS